MFRCARLFLCQTRVTKPANVVSWSLDTSARRHGCQLFSSQLCSVSTSSFSRRNLKILAFRGPGSIFAHCDLSPNGLMCVAFTSAQSFSIALLEYTNSVAAYATARTDTLTSVAVSGPLLRTRT